MSNINFSSPREAARVLTPKLSPFFDSTLITHLAFYTGLPAVITTPAIANVTLTDVETQQP